MKICDLRNKSIDDLNHELENLLKEKFNLRMQVSSEKSPNSHLFRNVRKNIVLIKTVITEKKEGVL
ncbi:50S ribosomal protein L29 [Buchnera aphidicola]|uniref:50S ribosomal protein L29 n=1 Tax=Buchnera aphidicola TaxID=9 RepID=UPI003464C756